jgi:hypothetical protein
MGRNSLASHHKHCNLHQEYLKRINHPSVRKNRSITQIINNETYIKTDRETCKLSGRSKDFAFKIFFEANDIILPSLALLGEEHFDMEIGYCGIEQFICKL